MRAPMSIAAALGVALAARGGASAPFGECRDVTVEAPGWVRIALDGRLRARERATWRILDPAGRVVPYRLLDPIRGRVSARTLSIEKTPEGTAHAIVFDLGPTPLRHRACHVIPRREVEAPGCALEGSRDGTAWTALASGTIFRIGSDAHLRSATLSYAPSDCRYLRLAWPASAGLPALESVAVETTDDLPIPDVVCPFELADEAPVRGAPAVLVALPPLVFKTAELDVAARGRFGYVIESRTDGAWVKTAAAAEAPAGDVTTVRLEPRRLASAGSTTRVRLFGGEAKLVAARGTVEPRWLLFRARTAGMYTLQTLPEWLPAREPAPAPALDRVEEPVMDLAFGEATQMPAPTLPRGLGAPYESSRSVQAYATYKVLAGDAVPGTIVRLDLPVEVLRALAERGGALRLGADGHALPFVRVQPTPLVPLFEAYDLVPQPAERAAGQRRLQIPAPAGLSLVELIEVALPPGARPRSVTVALKLTPRPGVERSTHTLGRLAWNAPETHDEALIPCEGALRVAIPPEKWERIDFTFNDEDRPPLENVTVTFLRARDALLCVWPAAAAVELALAADGDAMPPAQMLATHRSLLLALPAKEGRVDVQSLIEAEASAEQSRRVWLMAVLAAVACVLMLVLARALKAPRVLSDER